MTTTNKSTGRSLVTLQPAQERARAHCVRAEQREAQSARRPPRAAASLHPVERQRRRGERPCDHRERRSRHPQKSYASRAHLRREARRVSGVATVVAASGVTARPTNGSTRKSPGAVLPPQLRGPGRARTIQPGERRRARRRPRTASRSAGARSSAQRRGPKSGRPRDRDRTCACPGGARSRRTAR